VVPVKVGVEYTETVGSAGQFAFHRFRVHRDVRVGSWSVGLTASFKSAEPIDTNVRTPGQYSAVDLGLK
jgi:hypothetical protein